MLRNVQGEGEVAPDVQVEGVGGAGACYLFRRAVDLVRGRLEGGSEDGRGRC